VNDSANAVLLKRWKLPSGNKYVIYNNATGELLGKNAIVLS